MKERDYVVPQDVKDVFKDVAAHRMILDSKARYQEKQHAKFWMKFWTVFRNQR